MSQTRVVLCEGYHDRAFWRGWLESSGCKFGHETPLPPGYQKGAGEYTALTPSGNFLGVIPVGGEARLRAATETRLLKRSISPLQVLVWSQDAADSGTQIQDCLDLARRIDVSARFNSERDVEIEEGSTLLSLVRWEVRDEAPPGVPVPQTLERVVCTAIARTFPDRAEDVNRWLTTRCEPPAPSPKAFSWSYMAGWFPESGCDDFFRAIWRDAPIAGELRALLNAFGATRIAEILAQ